MYRKFLFPPSTSDELADQESKQQVHKDYILGALRDEELQAVLDASPIPRTFNTLKGMVSVGAYRSDDTSKHSCFAWGFLSKDGSISSLFVEESHRGQGLAVLIARELLRQQASTYGGATTRFGGKWWGHADVDERNEPSRRVMEKLGGKIWWGIQWVEIDVPIILEELDRAASLD
jgi:RimJ/RimL family protein N-acetyltransferase